MYDFTKIGDLHTINRSNQIRNRLDLTATVVDCLESAIHGTVYSLLQ